jgi:hypothetical protein
MTKPTIPTRLAPLRLVPLALVSVALGALVATAACSSDPAGVDPDGGTSTDSDSGGGGGGGGGGNDSGFDSGLTKTKCPPYVGPSGKGTATAAFGTLADVPEITCRTLRKRDGSVAGFAASFGRFQAVHPSTLAITPETASSPPRAWTTRSRTPRVNRSPAQARSRSPKEARRA